MKPSAFLIAALTLILIAIATQGFQCSSPDVTSGKLYYAQYESSRDTVKLNQALTAFQNEVTKNPSSAEGWYWLGFVHGLKKEYLILIDDWKTSLNISTQMKADMEKNRLYFWGQAFNSGVASLTKARASGKASYYQDAMNYMKSAIELIPDSSAKYGAYFTYAACIWEQKKYDDAIGPLKIAIEKEKTEDAYRLIGNYYLNKGDEHKKIFLEKNADANKTLSNKDKIKKGIPAKEVIEIIGEPSSKKPIGKKAEEWTYDKGYFVKIEDNKVNSVSFLPEKEPRIDSTEMVAAQKEYTNAIKILTEGTVAHPNSDNLRSTLINAYVEANRAKEALDLFKDEVVRNPNNKVSHYNYGVVLLSAKIYDESIVQFSAALAIDPNYENAIYNISRAYVNQGVELREKAMKETSDPSLQSKEYLKKFELALPFIEHFLKLKPSDAESWELAGRIYTSLGKGDKATEAFEKADKLRKGIK